jgi:hypothetical protein
MAISPEVREKVASELKQFAGELSLSEEQKEKLRSFLSEGEELGQWLLSDRHPRSQQSSHRV